MNGRDADKDDDRNHRGQIAVVVPTAPAVCCLLLLLLLWLLAVVGVDDGQKFKLFKFKWWGVGT